MSRWLKHRVPRVTINWDAGPSWVTCAHRWKCGCEQASDRAQIEQRKAAASVASVQAPAPTAAPAPALPAAAKPRTWRDAMEASGDWRDTIMRMVEAIRPFPDAARAAFAALEPSHAPA